MILIVRSGKLNSIASNIHFLGEFTHKFHTQKGIQKTIFDRREKFVTCKNAYRGIQEVKIDQQLIQVKK